jgi:hypothetical protein
LKASVNAAVPTSTTLDCSFTISAEPGAKICAAWGVHEKTIMKVGGWKTRSVFDRYNIVGEKDLADAAARLDRKAQQRIAAQ